MKERQWVLVALMGVVVVGAGCSRGESEAAERAAEAAARILTPSDVAVARAGTVEAGLAVTGSLNPYRTVEVRAQASGVVERVLAEPGMAVRRDQPLAEYGAAVRSQLAGAEAAVAAAEAAYESAMQEFESAELLAKEGAISDRDLRRARAGATAARAQLAAAQAALVAAREGARDAVVRAPVSGIVSARNVSAGEVVGPGAVLFTIVDVDTLELAGKVPAEQVGRVAVGRPVTFSLSAYPGRTFRGHVARVEPVADPQTRQVSVYVRLPNTSRQLVGGLYATGRIVSEAVEAGVTVPAAGVRGLAAEPYVLVVEADTIARRPVVVGARDEASGVVAVTSGLAAGETVVIGPETGLESGTRVKLVGTADAPSPEVEAQP